MITPRPAMVQAAGITVLDDMSTGIVDYAPQP